jgi:hypothetical protein
MGNALKMKVRLKKNMPNALIISVGLHILLLLTLGTLYRQKSNLDVKPVTEFDIIKVRSRSSLRPVKRFPHFSLRPVAPTENVQQMQTVEVEPPALETLETAVSHQDATVELQTPELSSPNHSGERAYGESLQAKPVGGSGVGGTGSGLSARISGNGKFGNAARGFLGGTGGEPVSDLQGLTLPDLALTRVGKHIVANRSTNLVDVVFVVDGSGSMKNDIDAVREHLNNMTDLFDSAEIDFTIGVVAFRAGTGYGLLGLDFEVIPQTRSVSHVKKVLSQLKFRGDENGLDALIRAADEVTFRRDAEVHFIFVTDEYVSGAYSSIDVMMKMKTARIKVDVIGRDEPFQKFIAKSTGGLWLPISSLAIQ